MGEPIVLRELIAQQADEAARRFVTTGRNEWNPYVLGTDAHAAWKAAFERYLLLHSAPGCESSA